MAQDSYAALRNREFRLLTAGNIAGAVGRQMLNIALSWEIYERTNSAAALGLVGLFQVIPLLIFSLHGGHAADRWSRKHIILVAQSILTISAASLALASLFHDRIPDVGPLRMGNLLLGKLAWAMGERGARFDDSYIPIVYAVIFVHGIVRSFNQPAKSAFLPQIVPSPIFGNAVAWNSSISQVCSMIGPTLAGGLLAIFHKRGLAGYPVVYGLNGVMQLCQVLWLTQIRAIHPARGKAKTSGDSLLAGLGYVWRTKVILAALTIDLFAVLLGGATALLPIFAKDILHTGPGGLGWLRAAPLIGAFTMGALVAHMPEMKHAGRNLLLAVAGFGIATIAFGLSKNFWLSFSLLAVTGICDNISVVIRHTLVQLRTPDAMRGRVSAVNGIFFGSADQLGTLESGFTAAAFGAVGSVVIGGVGTILVVIVTAVIWPQIRRLGKLHLEEDVVEETGGFPVVLNPHLPPAKAGEKR